MKSKNSFTLPLVSLIVLAVYCICMFILPLGRDGSFWSAFGFTVIAIFLNAGVGFYIFRNSVSQNRKFLRAPIFYVSNGYALAQLLWGIVVVAFPIAPTIAVIVSVVLLGGCVVLIISLPTSEAVVIKTEQRTKRKVAYLRGLQLELAKILSKCTDAALKSAIEKLSEAIRYSDPMSDDSLVDIEAEIAKQISLLGGLTEKPNEALSLCETIRLTLWERNERAKLLK